MKRQQQCIVARGIIRTVVAWLSFFSNDCDLYDYYGNIDTMECDLYCYIMVIFVIMVMYWQTDPTLVVTTTSKVRA